KVPLGVDPTRSESCAVKEGRIHLKVVGVMLDLRRQRVLPVAEAIRDLSRAAVLHSLSRNPGPGFQERDGEVLPLRESNRHVTAGHSIAAPGMFGIDDDAAEIVRLPKAVGETTDVEHFVFS